MLLLLPMYVVYTVLAMLSNKDDAVKACTQFLSLLPGKTGSYFRACFCSVIFEQSDSVVYIGFGTLFSQQNTTIQTGVYIGPQCNIGSCFIGKNTLLGSGVHLLSGKNQHSFDDPDTPIKDQRGEFCKITVGENCWVGNGAILMASIGDNCIVGAGSVVTNDFPEGSIIAGNPAKLIRRK